jgi:UDP-N-acetylglucosamine 2-epimerase
MLGNSSSGIIEAASFGLPVVNIGNRQSGRLQSKNVINVSCDTKNIMAAINKAKSIEFRSSIAGLVNIYGDGNVAGKIESVLRNTDISKIKYKKLCYR